MFIKASGLVTPVGFNSASSCAAMRAGVRMVQEVDLWDAESGSLLSAGKVRLPHWWVGVGKLAELVAPAIRECLLAAQPTPAEAIPVLLGVASAQRPHRFPDLDERIVTEIEHRLGHPLHPASQVIPYDQLSVIVALRRAEEMLRGGGLRYCIVAAVDSLLHQGLVDHYLASRRLLTEMNSNGFCPGEAGGALLVEATTDGRGSVLELLGTGTGREKPVDSDEPRSGEGLTRAIRDALGAAGLTIRDLQYRIADLSGEHDGFKEMVFAMMRHERYPKPKLFDLWHPSEHIGHVGAAIGPIVFAVALHAGQHGYQVGPSSLCSFGNDSGERAAAVVRFHGSANA